MPQIEEKNKRNFERQLNNCVGQIRYLVTLSNQLEKPTDEIHFDHKEFEVVILKKSSSKESEKVSSKADA